MNISNIILFAITVIVSMSAVFMLRRERRQIRELVEALADVKNGNGNRRILARTDQVLSPLVYEINDIVCMYEEKIVILQQMEETSKQLMTDISHDVRTPLTTLIGYLDAVHRGSVTGIEREKYIETARRKAYDLKEYIDALFDWSKLSSDEFSVTIKRVELAELTRNIMIDWIPILEDHKIEYSIEIPECAVTVNLDSDSYRRIINNLLQNSISHSHADCIVVALIEREAEIQISVADNGVGIQKEDLTRIFSRLYKCDKGRGERGSGLGLSIACRLAEKMGGRLTVDSTVGQGATFILTLPVPR